MTREHRKEFYSMVLVVCLILILGITLYATWNSKPGVPDEPRSFADLKRTEVYVVQPEDQALWTIAEKYMEKNTYGPREIREFYHGIIENNYEVFRGRDRGMIKPGDELSINYFVREGE